MNRRGFLGRLARGAVLTAASIYTPSLLRAKVAVVSEPEQPVREVILPCGCTDSCRWQESVTHMMLDNQIRAMKGQTKPPSLSAIVPSFDHWIEPIVGRKRP